MSHHPATLVKHPVGWSGWSVWAQGFPQARLAFLLEMEVGGFLVLVLRRVVVSQNQRRSVGSSMQKPDQTASGAQSVPHERKTNPPTVLCNDFSNYLNSEQ